MGKYKIYEEGTDFIFEQTQEANTKGKRVKKIAKDIVSCETAYFKYEMYNCSESCSEKMSYEIAKVLDYPCAHIELARDRRGKMGILNYLFIDKEKEEHHDAIDFINKGENEEKEYYTIENIKTAIKSMKKDLEAVIKESKNMTLIKEGIKTVIIGRPNVGKSSILNQLLQQEKAIVTDIAGTTRDIVEGEIYLDGILLNIIDTAGIRKTEDVVEKIGVEKSLSMIDEADLVIVVLNNNEKLTSEDEELLEKTKDKNRIIVINKTDLEDKLKLESSKLKNIVRTNANTVEGIKELKEKIVELFQLEKLKTKDYNYLTNARQISLAKQAYESLEEAEQGITNNLPIDMVEIDLKETFDLLGEIIGETYSEEIIDHLFANFCVGK